MTKNPEKKQEDEDDAAFKKALEETRNRYPVIMQYLAGEKLEER